jgi:Fe-S oxidoreductase
MADMERCSQCSYCKWIPLDQIKSWRFAKNCPSISYHNFNSYSARGRYLVLHSLMHGRSDYTDRVLDIVYKCVTCGNCDVSCKIGRYNMEPLEMIHDLRFKLVEEGLFVIVFGDAIHPEVQGVLGYARGNGMATTEIPEFDKLPQQVGLLSQTTQSFSGFPDSSLRSSDYI